MTKNTAPTTSVTVVVDARGDYIAHKAGCNHTSRRDLQDAFPAVPCANRWEAVASVYDNGIMDESEHDREDYGYWEGVMGFAPCLKDLPSALDAEEASAPEGDVTAEQAAEELARRAHNRKAKKDDSLERREATCPAAFALGTKELKALAG